MATLLVPESYGSISAAVSAASNGDTISIANGVYTEQVHTGSLSNVIITSRGTDPSAVTIQHNGASAGVTVALDNGCTLVGCTVIYTGAGSYPASGHAVGGAGSIYTSAFVLYNCRLMSEWNGIGMFGTGSVIERCRITCTSTGNANIGIYSLTGAPTIGSCIIENFRNHSIYARSSTIVNTLIVTNQVYGSHRFSYGDKQYNNIARNQSASTAHSGISAGGGASFCLNCTTWGLFAAEVSGVTTITAQVYSAAVVADGNDLFVLDGSDYHVNTAGLSYHSGDYAFQTATGLLLDDLDAVPYDDPPSRGCYEHVAPVTGTRRGARPKIGMGLGIGY